MKSFYLSRGQQVLGPYSVEKIEALRKSGDFVQYHYLWNPDQNQWTPLHAAPPPIVDWTNNSSKKYQVYLADQSYGSQSLAEFDFAELLSATPVGLSLKISLDETKHLSYIPGTPLQVLMLQESSGKEIETKARISQCTADDSGSMTLDLIWLEPIEMA